MRTLSKAIINNLFLNPNFQFLCIKKNNIWNWYNYNDLHNYISNSRKLLEELNIKKGDRVAYKGSNSLEWISWNIATNSLGAVWVPMYDNQKLDYCKHIIEDCKPKILLTNDTSINLNIKKINYNMDIDENANKNFDCINYDLATLIYTSGTTGGPKGVMLSNENILSNVEALYSRFNDRPQSTSLNILPWAHIYSQTSELYYNMMYNNKIALASSRELFLKECFEIKPDSLYVVPKILDLIKEKLQFLDKPVIKRILPYILHYILGNNIKLIFLGGAKLHEDTKLFFTENNIILCEGYGSTETSPIVCVNHHKEPRNIDSIGKKIDNIIVEIINNEIQVSGPNVMMGYWNNEQASKKALIYRNNKLWYKTGDSGTIDEQGFIYYKGRIGENYKLSNGKFVDVEFVENIIKKYVKGNFIIFGENMKNNNLITEKNINNETLNKINENLDTYLRIKNVYNIDSKDFNNFLTPKMSIKRKPLIQYILNKK